MLLSSPSVDLVKMRRQLKPSSSSSDDSDGSDIESCFDTEDEKTDADTEPTDVDTDVDEDDDADLLGGRSACIWGIRCRIGTDLGAPWW